MPVAAIFVFQNETKMYGRHAFVNMNIVIIYSKVNEIESFFVKCDRLTEGVF